MTRLYLLFFLLLGNSIAVAAQTDEQQIRSLLARQVTDWNKGDIPAYMQGYWDNDSLIFIGKNGPVYGYRPTLERYQKSYPDTAHMGQLRFEIVSLKRLSADHYFGIGKWALKRSAGDVGGSWTLLFRKINGKWKIVVDHSS